MISIGVCAARASAAAVLPEAVGPSRQTTGTWADAAAPAWLEEAVVVKA